MYLLKKILTQMFMPLPLALAFGVIGLLFLWFTRRQKTGKILTSAGVILLALFSFGFLPDLLIGRLEKQNAPLVIPARSPVAPAADQVSPKWIVVLGSGNLGDPRLPGKTYLTSSSLARVVEGIRLYHAFAGTKLMFCGGPTNNSVPEAETMAQTAQDLGVPRDDILLEPFSMDTEDQAARVKELVKADQFILMSSAFHLPRALALFRKLGLNPIPAPVDYRAGSEGPTTDALFPQATNVRKLELGIHEHLGLLWYWVRGKD
jgi:uncharacterized SAM-binding protein YcdF (DUF218 family)